MTAKKFEFSTRIGDFHQNLNFWPEFEFLTRIWIFDQNLNFWPELAQKNLNFRPELEIFTRICSKKIWIFDQNWRFSPEFEFFTRIWIFDQNWPKFCPGYNCLVRIWILIRILISNMKLFHSNFNLELYLNMDPKFQFCHTIYRFLAFFDTKCRFLN